MRPFPASPRSPGLRLRSDCAPVARTMQATSNRRQRPTSLNLSAAHSKRVSRSFDKFLLPTDLPRAAMPAIKPNAGKKWVDGLLKVKDFGLEGERLITRGSSMPSEERPERTRASSDRPGSLDLSRLSTTSRDSAESGRQASRKVSPPLRVSARQPSIDEIASIRLSSVVMSGVKSLDNPINRALRASRPSVDLIWTSKSTAEPPEGSPMASEMHYPKEDWAPVRLLMNTELEEPGPQAMESAPVQAELDPQAPSAMSTEIFSIPPKDIGPRSPKDAPELSPSASSEESVYSRPSPLPALQSGLWGPSRTSRISKGGLLSALPTGAGPNVRSARPIVTLTPFLEGTPVISANAPEPLGACQIGSGGTLSSDGASSVALSGLPRSVRDSSGEGMTTAALQHRKESPVKQESPLEQQRPSLPEPLALPRPPEQAAYHPFSHYSLRTVARSTLPEKVPIPFSVPSDAAAEAVSQDIEIDAGQPWAWSCSHPISPSTSARPKSTVKRPNTFEPPPTYSRRRASVFEGHHAQAQQGSRTLLAVQQPCSDPKTFVSGLLGPRGRRLSIVLPPVATISKKTLAVQVVGN
jgi:hypothetical protein